MKTKEELDALKNEYNALNAKLAELSNDELKEITGGSGNGVTTRMRCDVCGMELSWAGDYMNGVKYMCPQINGFILGTPKCTATEPSFYGYMYNP